MARTQLDPKVVNDLYDELLKAAGDKPVSYDELAQALKKKGIYNKRTRTPFTRQALGLKLTDPRNTRGRELVAENKRRAEHYNPFEAAR